MIKEPASHAASGTGRTLITFLGTGRYNEAVYRHEAREARAPYFARAAAELFHVRRIVVLATEVAWRSHGQGLRHACGDLPGVVMERRCIPHGQSEDELWRLFQILTDVVTGERGVVLDISHGFRSLPFFAAACAAFLHADERLPEDFAVVYAAFDARGAQGQVPVWELTPFLALLEWALSVKVFAATGFADPLLGVLRQQDRRQRDKLLHSGARRFPPTGKLTGALQRFANDYATVRIAAMVRGQAQQSGKAVRVYSSAALLQDAVKNFGREAAQSLPPLQPLLARLSHFADGLAAPTLHGEAGDRALLVLARRYLAQHRYSEAAITVREAWVSRCAAEPSQTEAGAPGFDKARRQEAERAWAGSASGRAVASVRNDIEHGGYCVQPMKGDVLQQRIRRLVVELEETASRGRRATLPRARGITWFVSRHPGALEWARRHGLTIDRQVSHLDPAEIHAGDKVIGSLPVHLAATVCARGARYLNLSIDLPLEERGRELSADELERHGARLEEFTVRPA